MNSSLYQTKEEFFAWCKERNPDFRIETLDVKSNKRDWLAETMTSREQGEQLMKWMRLLAKDEDEQEAKNQNS